MNTKKLEETFMREVLPQLEEKHKVNNIEKMKGIYAEAAKMSEGPNPQGLRESALPKSLRPGHGYIKRLLTETDAVQIKKRQGSNWYYVDPINNKVFYSYERWKVMEVYFERLSEHLSQDPQARREIASAFNIGLNQVDGLMERIKSTRDVDLFNRCVQILLKKYNLRDKKYGFLNWRPGAQYVQLSDFHKKLMEE